MHIPSVMKDSISLLNILLTAQPNFKCNTYKSNLLIGHNYVNTTQFYEWDKDWYVINLNCSDALIRDLPII